MRKVGMSVSLSIKTIMRVDEHIKKHGGNFSGFVDIAAAYYLDHNQNVTEVSINDNSVSTEGHVSELIESIKDIPEDTEPPPTDNTPVTKNAFNFDDVNFKS